MHHVINELRRIAECQPKEISAILREAADNLEDYRELQVECTRLHRVVEHQKGVITSYRELAMDILGDKR